MYAFDNEQNCSYWYTDVFNSVLVKIYQQRQGKFMYEQFDCVIKIVLIDINFKQTTTLPYRST